jgi:hypothetical protein
MIVAKPTLNVVAPGTDAIATQGAKQGLIFRL